MTEESTPPDSAQITAPVGACARIAATFSCRNDAIVHSGFTPQTRNRKFSRIAVPFGVWRTSGWNWSA